MVLLMASGLLIVSELKFYKSFSGYELVIDKAESILNLLEAFYE